MRVWYKKSDEAHFCLLLSCSLFLLLCTLLYHYTTILQCCLVDGRHTRELDRVNDILLPGDVLASGPCTPWSPTRGWMINRPGPIAATRLLDLEDDEFERPADDVVRRRRQLSHHLDRRPLEFIILKVEQAPEAGGGDRPRSAHRLSPNRRPGRAGSAGQDIAR